MMSKNQSDKCFVDASVQADGHVSSTPVKNAYFMQKSQELQGLTTPTVLQGSAGLRSSTECANSTGPGRRVDTCRSEISELGAHGLDEVNNHFTNDRNGLFTDCSNNDSIIINHNVHENHLTNDRSFEQPSLDRVAYSHSWPQMISNHKLTSRPVLTRTPGHTRTAIDNTGVWTGSLPNPGYSRVHDDVEEPGLGSPYMAEPEVSHPYHLSHIREPERKTEVSKPEKTDDQKEKKSITTRTFAHGLMDVSLLTSNASQLRAILANPEHDFYTLLVWMIGISIVLQITSGVLLLMSDYFKTQIKEKDRQNQKKRKLLNFLSLSLVLVVTSLNILIATFSVPVSHQGQGSQGVYRGRTEVPLFASQQPFSYTNHTEL